MVNNYILKKKSLSDYQVLKEPGTYIVKVSTCSKLYLKDDYPRYIVNLKVATNEGFEKCLKIMGNKEEISFFKVSDYFLSGVIWEKQIENESDLPVKNEEVVANFDYVDQDLKCVSISLLPREKLNKFQLDNICQSRKLLKNLLNGKN
jgi:hypothetical protein